MKVPQSEILVKAVKFKDVSVRSCQQSDYLYAWNKKLDSNNSENRINKRTIISKLKKLIPKKIKIILKAKYQYYFKPYSWFRSDYLQRENLKDLLK